MDETPRFTNRLAKETSPYLLQHAHNPVDWYPWGEEAFARARAEDKPVFLSIGYSACHWCHVMEHESFENPDIAALLNERFLAIKVDREERPDVDEIYMTAVQMITGSGGWPLSLFLLPDGRPFYGGTYYPPESRYNRIGFKSLLTQLADAWTDRRAEVEQSAESLAGELQKVSRQSHPAAPGAEEPRPSDLLTRVVADLQERFDPVHGGFGSAPKFPPHHSLRLLTLAAERGDSAARAMLCTTLDRMAIGGLYDHVGGGFHRYATDAIWLLPHFEKMLYDNALLARVYAEAFALTGEPAYARVARETCDWLLRDLLDDQGGFQSALDADSEGEEGKYYVWTPDEIAADVDPAVAPAWLSTYHIQPGGNYRDEATGHKTGASIPNLGAGDPSATLPAALPEDIVATTAVLRALRYLRVPPGRDDKVITAWNGLTIGALALCGKRLDEPKYIDAARRAADFCLTVLCTGEDRLLRRYAKGQAGIDAFLDDYAFLADGLLDLHDVTGAANYANAASWLADAVLADFSDPDGGGFFYTSGHHETLVARTKDIFDGALPSANGMMARVLARLAALPDGDHFSGPADRQIAAYAGLLQRAPEAAPTLVEAVLIAERAGASSAALVILAGPAVLRLPRGGHATVTFELRIASGYHVNAAGFGELPTVAAFSTDAPITVGPVRYPIETIETDPLGDDLRVYRDTVALTLPIVTSDDARSGDYVLELRVRCQACGESACLPPIELAAKVRLSIP